MRAAASRPVPGAIVTHRHIAGAFHALAQFGQGLARLLHPALVLLALGFQRAGFWLGADHFFDAGEMVKPCP